MISLSEAGLRRTPMPVGDPSRHWVPGRSIQVQALGGASSLAPLKGPPEGGQTKLPPPAPSLPVVPPAPVVAASAGPELVAPPRPPALELAAVVGAPPAPPLPAAALSVTLPASAQARRR